MERNFTDLKLADFDMGFDEHAGLIGALIQDGPKNLGMLIVGRIDSGISSEIKASNHPNFLRDLPVSPGDCRITCRLNNCAMKGLIELAYLMRLGKSFRFWGKPDFAERLELGVGFGWATR